MFKKIPVGDHYYLWKNSYRDTDPGSGCQNRRLLIAGHGEQIAGPLMTWYNPRLYFYSPPGTVLKTYSLSTTLLMQRYRPVECVTAKGYRYNYLLSKNRFALDFLPNMRENLLGLKTMFDRGIDKEVGLADPLKAYGALAGDIDVLTVRNRWDIRGPIDFSATLSHAINTMYKNSYKYETILCCFCRGADSLFGSSPQKYRPDLY